MNVGLVLSGGMAKGAYQIGALKAISEFLPLSEFKHISCASVGVLNGYAFATDNLDKAEEMWKNICNNDSRLFINQILRSSLLQQNIKDIYDPKRPLNTNFYCSLLDLDSRNLVYKNLLNVKSESIPRYLKASVAMPIYNKAVQAEGVIYFDGAMVDNIPVFPLMKQKIDYFICIHFDDACYKFENAYFDNKIITITFPKSLNSLKESLVFDQKNIDYMINRGYERTKKILSPIFANGYDDLDAIYAAIEERNKNKIKYLRITGDVLVTNLNKITQKLTNKKII